MLVGLICKASLMSLPAMHCVSQPRHTGISPLLCHTSIFQYLSELWPADFPVLSTGCVV